MKKDADVDGRTRILNRLIRVYLVPIHANLFTNMEYSSMGGQGGVD